MEKSRLIPQQAFEWLGIQSNLKTYRVLNSPTQCQKFNSQLEMISTQGWFTKRNLMGIQGIANWLGQVDPLRRTVFSQSRPLLRALRHTKDAGASRLSFSRLLHFVHPASCFVHEMRVKSAPSMLHPHDNLDRYSVIYNYCFFAVLVI